MLDYSRVQFFSVLRSSTSKQGSYFAKQQDKVMTDTDNCIEKIDYQ